MLSSFKYSARGFTLVETMVTLVILSIGMLALGTFYISLMDSQKVAQERLMAVHLAEQVIEYWQNDASDRYPSVSNTCSLSAGGSALVSGFTASSTCTPASFPVAYTIAASASTAQAPLPSHPNNDGDPLVSPPNPNAPGSGIAMGNMVQVKINTGTAASPTLKSSVLPLLKRVTVSWSHKGQARNVTLTHISAVKAAP